MKRFLSHSLVVLALTGQIIISPRTGNTGNTTIINNNTTNITNTSGTFLVDGGQVVWIDDFDFTVSAATYFILNSQFTSVQQDFTLAAADPTNPRFDVVVLDNTGTVVVVEGTPAADPSEPSIDPGSQLRLVLILVEAAATQPSDVANTTIYADNAGSPTEWDCTDVGTGFDCDSTNDPKPPSTKDIEGTAVAANAYAQLQIGTGAYDPSTTLMLVMYIKSKASWLNNRGLQVGLFNSGVLVGQNVVINRTGTWGFDSTNTTDYQQVAIPVSNFAVPSGTTITQIRIAKFGGGANIGFHIDDIFFQGGALVPPAVASLPYTFVPLVAGCQNTTASLGLSTPTTNPAVAACVTGTNTQYAVAQFADSANLSVQGRIPLPIDWLGTVNVRGRWRTSATAGNVVFQVATTCVGDGETGDPAFNTSTIVIDAAKGTTLQFNDFLISEVDTTDCDANEEMFLKVFRDAAHGSDNLAATAELISLTFLLGRAQ